jgi:hypothetical protein
MSGKTKLFLLFFACLLTMCTSRSNQVVYSNGLSCQDYTGHRFFEWSGEKYNFYIREEGTNCSYTCSDGTVKEVNVSGTDFSLDSSSKDELDAELCGITVPTATAMASLLTEFPVSSASSTPVASRTPRTSPTAATTSVAQASPTGTVAIIVPTGGALLTGTVSMCDLGGKLINFRMEQPPQDITGRELDVQIAERESICYINPANPSLLTCTLPVAVSFPARVVVNLDGALVNDFVYSGRGCAVITTPTPAPRPTREPEPTTYP